MTTKHFTAWLVNDRSALETDYMDVTVIEDELIGGDPEDETAWASHGDQQFHAVTTVDARDGDAEDGIREAVDLLDDAGWRVVGKWEATPNAYTATVERA
ncbi:hypothetical protein ACTWP5_27510 [Streptomyces sp. 4N509B]|uniref:hypothetical protein n=1 Tax=Streptomyces sp. 4N509B TaxID=3457413 RepID=UPI003FD3E779